MSASSWILAISLNVGGNFISAFGWMLQKKQHNRSCSQDECATNTNPTNPDGQCVTNSKSDLAIPDLPPSNVTSRDASTVTNATDELDSEFTNVELTTTIDITSETATATSQTSTTSIATDKTHKTNLSYVIAWRWWLGFLCYGGGSGVAAISYTYGPQSLLIPLETIILVFNIILGAKFLNERMFVKDYIGITLIFVGVVISVVAAPKEQQEEEYTIHELMHLFAQSSFWTFITCYTVIVFTGYLLYKVPRLYQYVASTNANIFLVIFINLSAYFGSWNAILLKSVLEIMASSFGGKARQNFIHFATYLLFIGFVGSILMLEFWRQKALALYVSTYVLAVYRVFVTTAGVLFGAFYWNDFVGTKGVYIGIYVLAILVSFVGVAVIALTENTKIFKGFKKPETNVAQNVCQNEDNEL